MNDVMAQRRSGDTPNGFESREAFEAWTRAWVDDQDDIDDPTPCLDASRNLQFYQRDVPDYRL